MASNISRTSECRWQINSSTGSFVLIISKYFTLEDVGVDDQTHGTCFKKYNESYLKEWSNWMQDIRIQISELLYG